MTKVKQVWCHDHVIFPSAEMFIVLPSPKQGQKVKLVDMEIHPSGVAVNFTLEKRLRQIVIPFSNVKSYEVALNEPVVEESVTKKVARKKTAARVVPEKF